MGYGRVGAAVVEKTFGEEGRRRTGVGGWDGRVCIAVVGGVGCRVMLTFVRGDGSRFLERSAVGQIAGSCIALEGRYNRCVLRLWDLGVLLGSMRCSMRL